VAESQSQSPGF